MNKEEILNLIDLNEYIVLDIQITDETDVIANSIILNEPVLNKKPANGHFGFKFSDDTSYIFNDELREVTSVVLVPDQLIKRHVEGYSNVFVRFSKDTIRDIRPLIIDNKSLTVNHKAITLSNTNSQLVELYIHDTDKVSNQLYETLANGSLIATYKILDDELWQSIKDSDDFGFSLELNKVKLEVLETETVKDILETSEYQDDIYDFFIEMAKYTDTAPQYLNLLNLFKELINNKL
jgi:hypothetical protein